LPRPLRRCGPLSPVIIANEKPQGRPSGAGKTTAWRPVKGQIERGRGGPGRFPGPILEWGIASKKPQNKGFCFACFFLAAMVAGARPKTPRGTRAVSGKAGPDFGSRGSARPRQVGPGKRKTLFLAPGPLADHGQFAWRGATRQLARERGVQQSINRPPGGGGGDPPGQGGQLGTGGPFCHFRGLVDGPGRAGSPHQKQFAGGAGGGDFRGVETITDRSLWTPPGWGFRAPPVPPHH